MADLNLTANLNGTGNKGPIGPLDFSLILQNMRGYVEGEFVVDPADAGRSIALPAEGSAQRMFLLCADGDFDFTINGAGITYQFRPGAVVNGAPSGLWLIHAPLVTSFEVTGTGALAVNGYWLRVVES